jgi:hypothetical protein
MALFVGDDVTARTAGGRVDDSRSEFFDRSVFAAASQWNDDEWPVD